MADQQRRALETTGKDPVSSFGRLDAVLSGGAPSVDPEGFHYEDPQALYRAELERVRREGLVH